MNDWSRFCYLPPNPDPELRDRIREILNRSLVPVPPPLCANQYEPIEIRIPVGNGGNTSSGAWTQYPLDPKPNDPVKP